ncbi:Immunoglobulin superfamily member 10 [Schistosoma japonicum]|uniref:Immunoglobulin superfamily member 10 n=1 Tax=Schistosoma japonicum TaxID=6182 RepID=A0A4Z2DBH2_SCHJA|nr:Immunoglobulin superfamily member 10 [Schistosoma japonicum]
MHYIFFLLLTISTPYVKCACLQLTENDRPVLFCQSTIPSLPIPRDDIPAKVAKLIISDMNTHGQHNGILSRDNLTGLETLTYLQISNFNLKVIETHTFSAMEHLRVLDLSKNRITTIRPGAFAGPSLKLLSLTDNKGIIFDRESFHGAHVFHLAARNCDLTSLDYDTIAEAKPKQLSLSDNILTWLDPQFAELIVDSSKSTNHHLSTVPPRPNLGYLDLSNNPLNCDCQLVWLSRLVESQSYDAYQYVTSKDLSNNDHKKDVTDWSNSPTESSIRLMQHMNMTCAQPPALAGKKLPRSWDYFCPIPSITGIEINMLKPSADFAQLTCIGKGRPTPSLAWTYKIHGQKVQQILDPSVKQQIPNGEYFLYPESQSSVNILPGNKMIERKLALNVSLNSVNIENFTCTIWNNDRIPPTTSVSTIPSVSSDNIVNTFKPTSLIVPTSDNHQAKFQYYRLHEVTVRVSGPLKPPEFLNPVIISGSSDVDSRKHTVKVENAEISMTSLSTDSQITDKQTISLQEGSQETYSYLFIKRFTLLELLGAVVGTFIATLALLYLATNCLSWFCQINNHLSAKSIRKSHLRPHGKWFSWINNSNNCEGFLLRGSSKHQSSMNYTPSHHPNQNGNCLDAKLIQRADVETTCTTFADMVLTTTSTTPMSSQFGSTTISARRPNIPQALLLTTVPNPRLEANSTPPPNPAYWPMPEYAYSGAGSHEYDVPRPLETFVGERCILKSGMTENSSLSSNAAQSFLSLAAQSLFPMNGSQLARCGVGSQPNNGIFQSSANIPPLTMQWTQTINPNNKTLTINPIISWQPNLVGSHTSSGFTDRQTQNSSYTNQPSTQSILYSPDYPTYLQTRPYLHHKEQNIQEQQQQLIELMTNSTRNFQSENFMNTPVDIHNSHDLPRKAGSYQSENKTHVNGTNS